MGGFVSGPGGLMARMQRRALVIQEQNSVPGMTNQWLSRIADACSRPFPAASRGAACHRQRQPGARGDRRAGRASGALGRPNRAFSLLVVGGSLGAQALNEQVPKALALLPADQRPLVRHQAGERTLSVARQCYAQAGVEADVTPSSKTWPRPTAGPIWWSAAPAR
jgi:UDP-N-acetylglucosamine--N-acetylmuramyl-(pentapeptide) pyrophosphoryl-undecaprenol N-acetylglucosamine transferase